MSSATSQPKQTIRQMRQAHGWTQAELAGRLGVTPDLVARWERGDERPTLSKLLDLAKVFGISVTAIAFLEPERP